MTDLTDLHRVLAEATDHLRSPDLTDRALASASRRRARRTTLGALAVVVLLGGGVAWAVQDRVPRAGVVDTPSPSPSPTPSRIPAAPDDLDALLALPTPPATEDAAVQSRWDPRTAAELPAVDLGLPASLDPPDDAPELTSMPAAVAMVEDQRGVSLVDDDGSWRRLPLPEHALDVPSYVPTSRLSTDGTRVVFLGRTSLWSRDVRSTRWRRLPYPEGFLQRSLRPGERTIPQVIPMVAEHLWLARETWWFVDLDAATFEVHPTPRGSVAWGGGDVYVESSVDSDYTMHLLSWGQLGSPFRSFRTDSLSTLTSVAANTASVAAVRGACVGAESERGLVALDLDDLSTRAYLPVRDPLGTFTCGGALETVAWLDPDTVLGSAATVRGPEAGRRTFFTWDVETGALRRASSLAGAVRYDVAAGALTPVPAPNG